MVAVLLAFLSTAWLVRRQLQYSRMYTTIKLGKRRCCTRRQWRLDFPRRSRFARHDTTEGAKLGNGAFGEVNRGTLQVGKAPLQIAVKHVLESKATTAQRMETIVECRLQCEMETPFVVKCFGFTTGPGPGDFSILLELMDLGDLPGYAEAVVAEGGGRIPEATRLRWMIEVAAALEYMHASNLIHADVAARNLVLCHSKTGVSCKLTDFGLSHTMDPVEKAYLLPQGSPVSLRWTAPECLPCDANFAEVYGSSSSSGGGGGGSTPSKYASNQQRVLRLTPANDTWSFGVTMWEIEGLAANGKLNTPLEDVAIQTLHSDLLTKKAKLDFKFECHDATVDTFKTPELVATESCLRVRPWARASMAEVRRRLQASALCEAPDWEQDDIHQWFTRMGAPRVEDADLWNIDSYDLLMSEILKDDVRPDYMAELKDSMEDEEEFLLLSTRLGGELAGLGELTAFVAGDTWPKGDTTGHPERFTWMLAHSKDRRSLRHNKGRRNLRSSSSSSSSSSSDDRRLSQINSIYGSAVSDGSGGGDNGDQASMTTRPRDVEAGVASESKSSSSAGGAVELTEIANPLTIVGGGGGVNRVEQLL